MGLGIRDRIIDTAVRVVDLVVSGDLLRKAKETVDGLRGVQPAPKSAYEPPPYTPPPPPPPAKPAAPAPAAKPSAAPAYKVDKVDDGWRLLKDGDVHAIHKRKQEAIKEGRTLAREAKGTLTILKLDGEVGEEVDYADA